MNERFKENQRLYGKLNPLQRKAYELQERILQLQFPKIESKSNPIISKEITDLKDELNETRRQIEDIKILKYAMSNLRRPEKHDEKKEALKQNEPLKHIMVKEEVNKLLKNGVHEDMDEKFREVADKLGMSFDAVKKAYYYKGKK